MNDAQEPPRDGPHDFLIRGGRVVSILTGEQLAGDALVR
jgi:hypothetical protein